jgi:hypothetical protein
MGALGLVIGIGGFWLTLSQISKIKTVAQAQEEAISSLRVRLASFDAIQECASAQMFLNAVRDAINAGIALDVISNYDRLAICFINIAESGSTENQITMSLREASQRIAKISSGLESESRKNGSPLQVTKHLDMVREFHTLLVRIRLNLHREH